MKEFVLHLFIFSGFLGFSFASDGKQENSSPEFECTVLEFKDLKRRKEFFGDGEYPSMSLRFLTSGEWQFRMKSEDSKLSAQQVVKRFNLLENETSYEVRTGKKSLKFDLVGKSPSRNGMLWELNRPPMQSKVLARITCH